MRVRRLSELRLPNEALPKTRSALTTIIAALAAEPRCWPDLALGECRPGQCIGAWLREWGAPFLWFDNQAEEAAAFYTGIFPNSRIHLVSRYGEAGPGPAGSVLTVVFELDGQELVALNGGPQFRFTEAVSFSVECHSQEDADFYWTRLTEGGEEQPCGWLKDKYGLSWQVIPRQLVEMLGDPDAAQAKRVTEAMLKMKKIDIETLERAYDG